jgi:hypothetical protein
MSINNYSTISNKVNAIPVQKGFWVDEFIGDSRQKLEELYSNNPQGLNSEKSSILSYWSEFEHLQDILGENWEDFKQWFLNKATSPETITRTRREMKSDGTIILSSKEVEHSQKQELLWREYWSREATIGQV